MTLILACHSCLEGVVLVTAATSVVGMSFGTLAGYWDNVCSFCRRMCGGGK